MSENLEVVSSSPPATSSLMDVAVSRASQEVQAAMVIAKKFPRNTVKALEAILESCKRTGLAEVAGYAYPRGGATVAGPSIRLAEELARNWGNISSGFIELERRPGESVVMTYAWDLQSNTREDRVFTVAHVREVGKGANKREEPLTESRDIYEVVANQAARRKRACILAIIPGDICELAVEECDKTLAGGDGKPLIDRIRKMVATFSDFGVTASMIEQRLKHNLDATTEQELAILRKTYRAIADGFGSRADYFEAVGQERPPAPPKETKGAAAAQENPTPPPATAGEPPPRPAAPTRAPEAHAEVVEEEKKPAPKANGKHKIVQKTALEDKESVTLIASVVEFKTRVINKKPSVEAIIEAPEFKGTVYHIGCCAIHREGETDALVPPPEWQIKKPVKIALHGTKTGSMGVVAIVDLLNFVPEDEIQF